MQWEQIDAKLHWRKEKHTFKIYEDDDYRTYIIVIFSENIPIGNEHAQYTIENGFIIEILDLINAQFINKNNLQINEQTKFENCYKNLKTAFMSSYFPTSFYGQKNEYDSNGNCLQMKFNFDNYNSQIYYLKDCMLIQRFNLKKFHGEQICQWKNGALSSIVYNNGLKCGTFKYKSKKYSIQCEFKNDQIDGTVVTNGKEKLIPFYNKGNHWRFTYLYFLT